MTTHPADSITVRARLARLLGNATRLRLLHILAREGREVPLSQLLAELEIGKTCLSGHISKLVGAGLIDLRQRGRYRYARLLRPEVIDASECLRRALEAQAKEHSAIVDGSLPSG